jgi:hypothetical protein
MNSQLPRRKRPNLGLLALEPRWMFDGAALADAAHVAPDTTAKALIPDAPAPVQVRAADPALDGGRKEVVFVDTAVADYQTLEAAVKPGIEIVEIDGGQSGLAQMAKWAETHSGYDSMSILSHGDDASVTLGTDVLTGARLSDVMVQAELAEIGHALKAGGDLLLYGCDVAKGSDGQQFISDLAAMTGADVAASENLTGIDGDWILEKVTGAVAANQLDPTALAAFQRNLVAPSPFQIVVENPSSATPWVFLYDTAVDSDNNIYVVGCFDKTITFTINGTPTSLTNTYSNNKSVGYIAKYDATGVCLWAEKLADSTNSNTISSAQSVAIDSDGNIIVVGTFSGTAKFDPTSGASNTASNGGNDIFVTKLSNAGAFIWNKTYGGGGNDIATAVTTAGTQIVLGGDFRTSVDFGNGKTLSAASDGDMAGFAVSLNSSGVAQWACAYDDTQAYAQQHVYSIKSDGTNFFVLGRYDSSGTIDSAPGGAASIAASEQMFLQKLNASGASQWFEAITTGVGKQYADTMAVDAAGNVIVVGAFSDTTNFDPNGTANLITDHDINSAFVAKYNGSDGTYAWAKKIGGTGNMGGQGIAVITDGSNNIYVGGSSYSSSFNLDPAGGDGGSFTGLNSNNIFHEKLDSSGTYVWGKVGASSSSVQITSELYVNGISAIAGRAQANIVSISDSGTSITKTSASAGFVEGFGTDGTPYGASGGGGGGGGGGGTPAPTATTQAPAPTPTPSAPAPVVTAPVPVPPPVAEPPQTIIRDTTRTPSFTFVPTFTAPVVQAPVDAPKAPVGDTAKTATPQVALAPVVVAPPVIPVVVTSQFTSPTEGGGFRVPVVTGAPGGPAVEGLLALRPEMQVPPLADGPMKVTIPVDAFVHSRSDAVVTLSAARITGQPLPSWLNFDSRSGTLAGQPPADFRGTMVVRIIARDDKGQEATITVRINGLPEKTGAVRDGNVIKLGHHQRDRAPGKLAFTQQLKLAARFAAIRFS